MNSDPIFITVGNWTYGIREPDGAISLAPVMLMLHGLSGDEHSMWVFASRLPRHWRLLAPRALYPSPLGGYTWVESQQHPFPTFDDLKNAVYALEQFLDTLTFLGGNSAGLHLMGFSQGAALAYAFLIQNQMRVSSVAALAGFLPAGAEEKLDDGRLAGKRIFIAHGTKDEMVPVDRGRQAAQTLETTSAEVVYCEDNVGHKLSANCFHGLEKFFHD